MPALLLIEDNPHMQRVYGEKFRYEGFEVIAATTGEQGLRSARQTAPDVILLDIMLPQMDGFETLKRLRADPVLAAIPVFVLSNRAGLGDVQHALSLGARNFYAKGSITLHDIVAELCECCGFRKVMVASRTAGSSPELLAAIHHPQLLCSAVASLSEILSTTSRRRPDLIVLDARPPAPNSLAVLQHLKSHAATRAIPVIAITDQTDLLQRADAFVAPGRVETTFRASVLSLLQLEDSSRRPAAAAAPAA